MKALITNLTARFTDAKSRTILIFIGALMLIAVFIAASNMNNNTTLDDAVGKASITELGRTLESTPGVGNTSDEYNKLRYQKNQQEASLASSSGGSAVPTIVSDQVLEENTNSDLLKREQDRLAREREEAYRRLLEQRRQEELAALQRQQAEKQSTAIQARQQGYESLMTAQAQALFSSWGQVPRQQYVAGELTAEVTANASANNAQGEKTVPSNILYKAGDIVFAVLETSINSDEQSPIMARIVQGPLNGAKLIGNFQSAGVNADKLKLVFNVMNVPNIPRSISFSSVAIDPETARTAMATDVDNHYLLRYGSMFGSAFLEGMSNAVMASVSNSGFKINEKGEFASGSVKATSRDQVITGFGNVGKQIAQNTNFFTRPPTIRIDSGVGFGLLMLSDLNLNAPAASEADFNNLLTGSKPLTGTTNKVSLTGQNTNTNLDAFNGALNDGTILTWRPAVHKH